MNENLQKISEMIKKSFKTKAQVDCFDGCSLYMEAYYEDGREVYVNSLEEKFKAIDKKLDMIIGIVGTNGGSK